MTMPISRRVARQTSRRCGEAGYSLLMVVFLVATSLVVSAAVATNVLTQGRREREEETVWRGEQYERAIGLYFRKFGRYPTKIDDLTKQTNGVRFLRQAYTEPMNREDGSWRFIYVGPNGQLIGSLRSQSLLQNALTSLPGGSSLGAGGATAGLLGARDPRPELIQVLGRARVRCQQSGQQPGQPASKRAIRPRSVHFAITAPAAHKGRHRRKYHWSWEQDQGTIAYDL